MKKFLGKAKKPSKDLQDFDYKNPLPLCEFLEGGKITPARTNGLRAKQQKQLRNAIKKARNLGLVPIGHRAHDEFGKRPELISPKPFKF